MRVADDRGVRAILDDTRAIARDAAGVHRENREVDRLKLRQIEGQIKRQVFKVDRLIDIDDVDERLVPAGGKASVVRARNAAGLPVAFDRAGDGAVFDAAGCGVCTCNAAGIEPPGNRAGEGAVPDKAFVHRLVVAAGLDAAGDVEVKNLARFSDAKKQSGV